jgi:hypothetical protein
MWSKVYTVRNENNQEIGVALMDTQVNIDYQKLSGYLLYLKEEVVILKAKLTLFFLQNIYFKDAIPVCFFWHRSLGQFVSWTMPPLNDAPLR